MGRRDDYKDTPIYNSRHLRRWETSGDAGRGRQDTEEQYQRDVQRAAEDVRLAERHRGFDEGAKDNHMKYERASFSVVGEGSKSAQDKYREGWERIFGKRDGNGCDTDATHPRDSRSQSQTESRG